jgi:uncharacterized delta-60 repeat protein
VIFLILVSLFLVLKHVHSADENIITPVNPIFTGGSMKKRRATVGVGFRILVTIFFLAFLVTAAVPDDAGAVKRRWFKKVDGSNGPDYGNGVAVAPDGHIYVTGQVNIEDSNNNIWLRKYTPGGARVWTRSKDGPIGADDRGYGVTVAHDGNVYVAGQLWVSHHYADIWVRGYSPSGGKLWTRNVQGELNIGDIGFGAAVGPDGSVYITGKLSHPTRGLDVWLRKYTPAGKTVWTRRYDDGLGNLEEGLSVTVSPTGGVFVCGAAQDPSGGRIFFLRKYTNAGKKKWTIRSAEIHECKDVAATQNGAVYTVGTTKEAGPVQEDGWIRKYSRKGKVLWTKTYDGPANDEDEFKGVAVTPSGGAYATGYVTANGSGQDIVLVKYSPKGDFKWKRTYNHENDADEGRDIAVSPLDGSIYITGYVFDQQTVPDIFLLKYR